MCVKQPLHCASCSLSTSHASKHKFRFAAGVGETTSALSKGSRAKVSCRLAALDSSEMRTPISSIRICRFFSLFSQFVEFGPLDSLASVASMPALSAACQAQEIPCSSSYSRPRCQILVNTPAILHCWNLS